VKPFEPYEPDDYIEDLLSNVDRLDRLAEWIGGQLPRVESQGQQPHLLSAKQKIELFQADPIKYQRLRAVNSHTGSPIGS